MRLKLPPTHGRRPVPGWLATVLCGVVWVWVNLLPTQAPRAWAQDAGPDGDASVTDTTPPDTSRDAVAADLDASRSTDVEADSPDTAEVASPDRPDAAGADDGLAELPEPWLGQVLALRSDDADAVRLALSLDASSLTTDEDVLLRKRNALLERDKKDASLTALNDTLDRLDVQVQELEGQQELPGTSHARSMLDAVRLQALRKERTAVAAGAERVSHRLFVIQEELAFYDRQLSELQRIATLATSEEQRAVDNRAAAEREKVRAAEAREVTQRRLEQAEAERAGASNFEQEYQELANLEPRILEEKLYIEARRQYELSAQLEELGDATSSFNARKNTVDQAIATLRDRLERRERPEAAEAEALTLYRELSALRADARERVTVFDMPLRAVGASHDDVRGDVAEARESVQRLTRIYQEDRSDRLARKRLSVAQANFQRLVADELLLDLKRQVLVGGQELAYEQLLFARDRQQQVLDLLADEDRDALQTLNTQNLTEAPRELVDFVLATRHYVSARMSQLGQLGDRALSIEGMVWIFKLLVVVSAMVFAMRYLRKRKELWLERFSEWAMKQRTLRRRRNLVVKFFEVLNEVLTPLSILILMQPTLSLFPEDAPMVVIATVLINSTLIYMIIINVIKTIILPRWYRVAQEKAEQTDSSNDSAADFVPPGEDLLDLNVQVALFAVSTLRLMLLYTLICQYSLYLIRSALGTFFIAHWISVLGYLGYVVVIYVLLSRWKDAIAGKFASLLRGRSPQAVEFVTTRKDAFYGVGVIFGALIYVLAKEGYGRAKRYFTNLEIANQIQNFFFRKRIEMGAEAAGAEGEPRVEELPEDYRRLFSERPIIDEPWYVHRKGSVEAIEGIRSRWKQRQECASIALFGELGMGKTTLLNQLRIAWEDEGERVVQATMPTRLTTERQAINYLARLFGCDDHDLTVDQLVERGMALPPTHFLVDDCHNLFLRKISGFVALDAFRKVVRLTDQRHCWVLVFNRFAWRYLQQISDTSKLFGNSVALDALNDAEIRELVECRTSQTGYTLDFSRLMLDDDFGEDQWAEVSRSARGYYRLLSDHARGNPRVALHYWQRSISRHEGQLRVQLFQALAVKELTRLSDPLKFALAAIVQHDSLTVEELAEVIHSTPADALIAMNYFLEHGFVELERDSRRAHLTAALFRQTLSHLGANNFLPK